MTVTTAPRTAPARTAMIDVAEAIVAHRGLAALSLRQVQLRAGQANKSAAQYHFGSRNGLIAAILIDRMTPIQQRRAALLAEVDSGDPRTEVAGLIRAFVVPLAERILRAGGSTYGRFLAQAMIDPELTEVVIAHAGSAAVTEIRTRLRAALAPLAPATAWRIDSITRYVIAALAAEEARGADADPAVTDHLIGACTAMLTAPTIGSEPLSPVERTPS